MTITIKDDFDLQKIADSGQCFRWQKLGQDHYRIIYKDQCLLIRHCDWQEYDLSCNETEFQKIWAAYFDLDLNYEQIRSRIDKNTDPFLSAAAEHEQGIRILRQDPWETLISFIISQNRNIPAIKRSIELLCTLAGEEMFDPDGGCFYSFPDPQAILNLTEEELQSCKLGYRGKYILAAANAVSKGEIKLSETDTLSNEELLSRLTSIYGVGVKVASCVMLFGFHRLDAFPVDVWVKKILKNEYPDGYPMERYSPYNGIYQQYMFAYYRNTIG